MNDFSWFDLDVKIGAFNANVSLYLYARYLYGMVFVFNKDELKQYIMNNY